jgi:heme a synthase
LTVKLALPAWVSSLHLATAMAFFCTTVTLAFLTRQRLPGFSSESLDPKNRACLRRWILPVIAITYLQVCVGAVMRHTRGGLACGFDFPLCLGKLWPLNAHLGVQVHMIHRIGACLTAAAVIALAAAILHRHMGNTMLRVLVVLGAVTVLAQVALGIATILTSRELVTMTLHSSFGAALLASLIATYWVACPSTPPARQVARRPTLQSLHLRLVKSTDSTSTS